MSTVPNSYPVDSGPQYSTAKKPRSGDKGNRGYSFMLSENEYYLPITSNTSEFSLLYNMKLYDLGHDTSNTPQRLTAQYEKKTVNTVTTDKPEDSAEMESMSCGDWGRWLNGNERTGPNFFDTFSGLGTAVPHANPKTNEEKSVNDRAKKQIRQRGLKSLNTDTASDKIPPPQDKVNVFTLMVTDASQNVNREFFDDADEVLSWKRKQLPTKCLLLDNLSEVFFSGSNAALTISHSQRNTAIAEELLISFMERITGTVMQLPEPSLIVLTAGVILPKSTLVDLLKDSPTVEKKILGMGMNPIFGNCVANLSSVGLKSGKHTKEVVQCALEKSRKLGFDVSRRDGCTIWFMLLLRRVRKEEKDLYLSTMHIAMFESRMERFSKVMWGNEKELKPLFSSVFTRSANTVFAAVVDDGKDSQIVIDTAKRLREVEGNPCIHGSVKEFINNSMSELSSSQPTSGEEKKGTIKARKQKERFIQEATLLLKDPICYPAKVYITQPKVENPSERQLTHSGLLDSSVPQDVMEKPFPSRANNNVRDSIPQDIAVALKKNESKLKYDGNSKKDEKRSSARKRRSSQEEKEPRLKSVPKTSLPTEEKRTRGKSIITMGSEDVVSLTDDQSANIPLTQCGDDFSESSIDCKNNQEFSETLSVLLFPSNAPKGVTSQIPQEFSVDEILSGREFGSNSTILKSLVDVFIAERNASLMVADYIGGKLLWENPVWRLFRKTIEYISLSNQRSGSTSSRVFLHMHAVKRDGSLSIDLLDTRQSSHSVESIAVRCSPLFGPVIGDTKGVVLTHKNARDVITQALHRSTLLPKFWCIVATALQKNVHMEKADVTISSFTVLYAIQSVEFFETAIDARINRKSPLNELFSYAIGGPTASVFVTLSETSVPLSALECQRTLKQMKRPPSESCSVAKLTKVLQRSLQVHKSMMVGVTDTTTLRSMQNTLNMLTNHLQEHAAILQDPNAYDDSVLPRLHSPLDGNNNEAEDNDEEGLTLAVTPIVIVSLREGIKSRLRLDLKESKIMVLDINNGTPRAEFEVGELLCLSQNNKLYQSHVLKSMVQNFTSGYNAAVVISDANRSNASLQTLQILFQTVFRYLPQESELFMCMAAFQNDRSMDLLSDTHPLTRSSVAVSPLTGVKVQGTEYVQVTEAKNAEVKLRQGVQLSYRVEFDPLCILSLLLKSFTGDGDVIISNLLIVQLRGNARWHRTVYATNPHNPYYPLFNYLLKGPCRVVNVLGITETERNVEELLQSVQEIGHLRVAGLRHGSVRRYRQKLIDRPGKYTTPAAIHEMVKKVELFLENPRYVLPSL
ncbi:hypothetical protein LSM04_002519 [Trypanosoma melophagium]|uniref:uncharacterized protein n=1 Tax=Trypanosoma melophagium TaxID=715481 RepID=UPI00351AA3F2|nr:hypothetical protein LSM04_002519 [Trypanosoma melophagium]